ncbi:MAG: tripartite tricarboxylate transporter substrate binding protein [Betaproteobacteria bacterium]|nr:tripartite tricarboxylate transporter substrate binding protein [Betaproteobacteria bacterium]NBT10168.1 tripartite tricarboxylate transporter substrate binding protein [Betaproteobacteria bacterium]NBU49877.1 tripartite tricarboxylate transporter substrate binding protein [Betaproteobacteria bacterium]NBX95907.1 tripartite tricarboxylate transporter substrate binding protein [Betaproteobacteria bacterium]
MTRTTRRIFALTAAAALLCGQGLALAQSNKPMNLMVPYPAGGLSDAIARIVERPLAKALNQMIIVENLGGVGGALGAQKVLSAPADGQFLYQGSPNELILAPLALQAVRYKAEDFRFVQMIGTWPLAVLARPGLNVNTVDELVDLAKRSAAAGKPLTYGSVGVGSLYHVLGAHFAQKIGAEMVHIPYKGMAPLLQDMGGNAVDVSFLVVGEQTVGLADAGRLKVLATLAPSGKIEAPFLAKYPSINDSKSIKDFSFNTWTGYFVRKDTPEAVVQQLNKALTSVMGDGDAKAGLTKIGGSIPTMLSLAEADKEYAAQTARFRAIARSIKLEAQ